MNAGPTSTRIYDSLRTWILDRGFRPGSRLNPTLLADALSSSVTPVRDALHLLAGEELVTAAASGSFAMPLIDEPGLIDLYLWNGQVLELALRDQTRGSGQQAQHSAIAVTTSSLAANTAALFAGIAGQSRNIEHLKAIARINARLHGARHVESMLLEGCLEELDAIGTHVAKGNKKLLRQALSVYSRRRCKQAAEIVRHLYREGEG